MFLYKVKILSTFYISIEIPDNSLVIGNPGKVKRAVTEEEIRWNLKNAHIYVEEAQKG